MIKLLFRNLIIILLFFAFNICAQCGKSGSVNVTSVFNGSDARKESKLTWYAHEISIGIENYRFEKNRMPINIIDDIINSNYCANKTNIITNKPLKQVELGKWSPGDVTFLYSPNNDAYLLFIYHFNKDNDSGIEGYKGMCRSIGGSENPSQNVVLIDSITNKKFNFKIVDDRRILKPIN